MTTEVCHHSRFCIFRNVLRMQQESMRRPGNAKEQAVVVHLLSELWRIMLQQLYLTILLLYVDYVAQSTTQEICEYLRTNSGGQCANRETLADICWNKKTKIFLLSILRLSFRLCHRSRVSSGAAGAWFPTGLHRFRSHQCEAALRMGVQRPARLSICHR